MKKRCCNTLICFLVLFFSNNATAQTDTAIKTLKQGNWSDASVWSGLRIPGINDSIFLEHDINVDINATCRALVLNNKNVTISPGKNLNIRGFKPIFQDNTFVVDSNKMKLISTETELEAGTYKYSYTGQAPVIEHGFIIGSEFDGGYLRKVTQALNTGNTLQLTTTQAGFEDVFKKAHFAFGFNTSDLQPTGNGLNASEPKLHESTPYDFSIPSRNLVTAGPITIDLTGASFSLNPNFYFDFDYGLNGLNSFELTCNNATLNGIINLKLKANGSLAGSRTDTLYRAVKTVVAFVYGWPVHMKLDFFLIGTTSFNVDADIERTAMYNTNNNFSIGTKYDQGNWTSDFNINSSTNELTFGEPSGKAKLNVSLSLKPLFKVRFYSIVGPYLFLDVNQSLTGSVASPSLDWDLHYKGWAEPGIGLEVKIFGNQATNFGPKSWSTDTLHYRTPYKIERVSGDNQIADDTTSYLPQPIKVRIKDELNLSQSNVPVYFKVTAGGGKVSDTTVLSDVDGYAQTLWKLGPDPGIQYLKAEAKKADGSLLEQAPVEFAATVNADSTFTDPRDGQVYPYKTIGSQVWMTKNLNYASALSWCYDNNAANCAVYGRLYNWNTALTVAPPGWHLPSDAEWTTLITYLGGDPVAGGKMKDTTLWNTPNTGATNSSGFAGLPGGLRDLNEDFNFFRDYGYWWSSTAQNSTYAWMRYLNYVHANATRFNPDKTYEFSVRCVRD